jgi:integrase
MTTLRRTPLTDPSHASTGPWMERLLRRSDRLLALRGLGPATQRLYLSRIRRFLIWLGRYPGDATPQEVTRYLQYLGTRRGLSLSSCQQARSALRFLFREVLALPDLPGGLGGHSAVRCSGQPVLTPAQIRRLLAAAETTRDEALFGLLYGSGLRLSELQRLRVGDVRLRARAIRVRNKKGGYIRSTILSALVMGSLPALIRRRGAKEYVFPGSEGQAQKALAKAGRAAGLWVRPTPRVLRRSFASHLLARGVHPSTVQALLGKLPPRDSGRGAMRLTLPPGAMSPL